MDALSFSHPPTHTDVDFSMFMDTTQDFEPSQGGVVQWVASQSPNPALQALMKEAERDKRARPSTPVREPMSWTYPLTSTTVSASLSTSLSSPWHSSGNNLVDASCHLPLSGSTSSASSSSLASRVSEPSVSRHVKPLSAAQRKPLASSTSSANQLLHHHARPRSSSHSTISNPSTLKEKYTPQDNEPEALFFIELLKKTSWQVDVNAKLKEQAAREKAKEKRERSLGRNGIRNLTGPDKNNLSARLLTKTSSASAVCPTNSSTRALAETPSISTSAYKHRPRGRALAKTESSSALGRDLASGKSTPTSLPSPNLNCDPKIAPAPRLPAGVANISNANHPTTRNASFPEPTSNDGDSTMQDVIDLTETDTEWDKPIFGPISRADTAMYMELDDEASDTGMDMSFFKPEPPPQARVPVPKPKPQPSQPTRPPVSTQRSRTGPPPLGMRRAPQLQPSQYNSTQGPKSVSVPRFKPPLLANAGGTTNKHGSGTKPAATATSSRAPLRGATQLAVAEIAARTSQDPDSSFDVSFDVDADALEEAMKAYD
ncbi:hypothetical protein L210DRAFT_3761710 [Boletus edulis BED1]|uniref:Uncharacterized protein n=1 Tax=Boletus edulis BED1 TaxID=1328754 RepID=A0AAD4GD02_BOLED|nr:hypothetical protein L210DRAFT_3761710 [Boletus edulis BED1]